MMGEGKAWDDEKCNYGDAKYIMKNKGLSPINLS